MIAPGTIVLVIYTLSTIIWICKFIPDRPRYNISIGDIIIYSAIILCGFIPIFNTVSAISIIFDFLEERNWFCFGLWLTKPRFNKK